MKSNKMTTYCAAVCFLVPLLWFPGQAQAPSTEVEVIEIRNYLIKPGQRENYIEGFEKYFLDTLNAHKNYVLGQYRVKSAPDNFVWIRGFEDMPTRKTALERFFSSKQWEKHKDIPGNLLLGYTNVHLLKPLDLAEGLEGRESSLPTEWFGRPKGVTVVDFYVSNGMLDQLIEFVGTKYHSLLHTAGVKEISYWVSETSPNNYPGLPVFQDKNLLVSIAFYKNEQQYEEMMKKLEESIDEETRFSLGRLVTTRSTWVLYPTHKSFTVEAGSERSE